MLQIHIPESEYYDEVNNEFVEVKAQTLQLEHSLISLSKWEAKWCKPFLSKQDKTYEETLDYIKCMTIQQNVDPAVYSRLTKQQIQEINDYIAAPMTATYFSENQKAGGKSGEQVTNELIYYWMISAQIPFKCETWHLNRLLTLIRVCSVKNQPPKKMSKKATASKYAALNAARRQQLGTNG